jgi:hypothetical protein
MSKYNLFGIIAIVGIVTYAFGVWSKITHQAWSNTILGLGLILFTIGVSAFVWFIFMWLKEKSK